MVGEMCALRTQPAGLAIALQLTSVFLFSVWVCASRRASFFSPSDAAPRIERCYLPLHPAGWLPATPASVQPLHLFRFRTPSCSRAYSRFVTATSRPRWRARPRDSAGLPLAFLQAPLNGRHSHSPTRCALLETPYDIPEGCSVSVAPTRPSNGPTAFADFGVGPGGRPHRGRTSPCACRIRAKLCHLVLHSPFSTFYSKVLVRIRYTLAGTPANPRPCVSATADADWTRTRSASSGTRHATARISSGSPERGGRGRGQRSSPLFVRVIHDGFL